MTTSNWTEHFADKQSQRNEACSVYENLNVREMSLLQDKF